ncbi:unnamed protein product, partial [Nesidiocoris tenuis]
MTRVTGNNVWADDLGVISNYLRSSTSEKASFKICIEFFDIFDLHALKNSQNMIKLCRTSTFQHMEVLYVDPPRQNDAILEPPDMDYLYVAKVMLLSSPGLEELLAKTGITSELENSSKDESDDDSVSSSASNVTHVSRLVHFMVGTRGKEPMAIGGPWSPSLDGNNPKSDPGVLVKTAIRCCKALTGIDLSSCTQCELRDELEARNLSPKGLKSQLVARLAKAIKTEADEEEANGNVMDDPNAVLDDTVDNKETKESKENRPASPSQSTTSKKSEDKQKVKKLVQKVSIRDTVHYKKLSEKPKLEDGEGKMETDIREEDLVLGNRVLLEMKKTPPAPSPSKKKKATDAANLQSGFVMHNGSLIDVSKLLGQLSKSENSKLDTERELNKLKSDYNKLKETQGKSDRIIKDLQSDIRTYKDKMATTYVDLASAQSGREHLNRIALMVRRYELGTYLTNEMLQNADAYISQGEFSLEKSFIDLEANGLPALEGFYWKVKTMIYQQRKPVCCVQIDVTTVIASISCATVDKRCVRRRVPACECFVLLSARYGRRQVINSRSSGDQLQDVLRSEQASRRSLQMIHVCPVRVLSRNSANRDYYDRNSICFVNMGLANEQFLVEKHAKLYQCPSAPSGRWGYESLNPGIRARVKHLWPISLWISLPGFGNEDEGLSPRVSIPSIPYVPSISIFPMEGKPRKTANTSN